MHWELPGPDRYLENILDSLDEQKHALLVLPDPVSKKEPFIPLRRKIRARGMGDLKISSLNGQEKDEPFEVMARALGCDNGGVATLQELFDYPSPPSRFIGLDLTRLDPAHLAAWSKFLKFAGEHAQVKRYEISYGVVATVGPGPALPAEDLCLAHHPWWGILTGSDIDWFTERALENFPPASPAEHYWIRSLCRAFGGNDSRLIEKLIEEKPSTIEELIFMLKKSEIYDSGLEAIDISNNERLSSFGYRPPLPPRSHSETKLWRKGWLDWVNGRGLVVHAAILINQGTTSDIHRRIWLAQQELLLPLVEKVRFVIVKWLERTVGPKWLEELVDSSTGFDERMNISAEIGALAYHVFRKGSRLRDQHFLTVSKLVWAWREIRNALAHCQFITLTTLENALAAFDEFDRRCMR
jgi:hypothetical protein